MGEHFSHHDAEEREIILAEVEGRLLRGETMASICRDPSMPSATTLMAWLEQDENNSRNLARARDHGFDVIAQDAIDIVDGLKPAVLPDGTVIPSDITRDKARADIRLKLLGKWAPRRYGDAVQLRHADADGEKLDTAPLVTEVLSLMRGAQGALPAPEAESQSE